MLGKVGDLPPPPEKKTIPGVTKHNIPKFRTLILNHNGFLKRIKRALTRFRT